MLAGFRRFIGFFRNGRFGGFDGFFGQKIEKIGFFDGFPLILFDDFRLNGVFGDFFREDGNRKIDQQERGCQQPGEQLFSMGFAQITTSFEMENPLIREESGRLM